MALINAEKRIVLVFFALYYKLKQLRPPRYRFCKVYFCPNKFRNAHSSRACNFILRNKQATTFYILYVTISIFFIFLFIFHILLKLTLKSPYVGISNLVKNVIFFIILPMFQCLNFCKKQNKKTWKKQSKKIAELPLIMWFWHFSTKKKWFYQKSQFFDW